MGKKRVVITGMGAITPIGKNLIEYTSALKNGLSGCEEIKSFDTTKFKTKFACEVKSYDPLDYFDRKESRKMDIFFYNFQIELLCVKRKTVLWMK